MAHTAFLQQLIHALGADTVTTAEADIAPWLTDWRGLYHGRAQAVVRPRSTEQVAACLRLCHAAGVPVVPRGGNTGLCGGATPDANANNIVLSLDRMRAVRQVNAVANTLVAEAGCILADLQQAATALDRLLPLSLAAEGSCQLGGVLSTNAGGVHVVRYGMARDLVLGIEAVLPTGEVFHGLRTLRKDNTGYDLKQLLIGAEGTLGVITAAALRLFPRPTAQTVALAAVDSPAQALALFATVSTRCGQRLQAFEFFTHACLDLVLQHVEGATPPFDETYAAYVLIELADTGDAESLTALVESALGAALEQGACEDAIVANSLAQHQALWRLREDISEALRAEGPHLKHDISVPIEFVPAFISMTDAQVRQLCPGVRPMVFGHFGDGNLHYNLARPLGAPADFFAQNDMGTQLTDAVLTKVVQTEGSISAEHGIGQLKRAHFAHHQDPLQRRLMQDIKRLFDPKGIMNPGKLL